MADLGTLGGVDSHGLAVNVNGQVAGDSRITGRATSHAFLYTGTPGSGGAMADLGTLAAGFASYAFGINAAGQVTGYSGTVPTDAIEHAFLYSGTPGSGGHMIDLGTVGGSSSAGRAINVNGQVAGESYIAGDGAQHAFLYSGTPGSGGHMSDLGTLGGTSSYASAINAGGQVVGNSATAGNANTHAFLYTGTPGVNGQMIDLDAWLDANNPTDGSKWTLFEAHGLTDSGLVTGYGFYSDGPGGLSDGDRAFLLDASALVVPEPAGILVMGIGATLIVAIGRTSRRARLQASK